MSNEEQFLKAEEAASLLTESLVKLKTEMESYHSAAGHLDTAATSVAGLAEQTAKMAQDVQMGLDSIRSAGGPEILDRIDQSRNEIAQSSQELAKCLEILPGISAGVASAEQTTRNAEASLSKGISLICREVTDSIEPLLTKDFVSLEQATRGAEASLSQSISIVPQETATALQPIVAQGTSTVEQALHDSEESLSGRIESVPSGTVQAMQPFIDSLAHEIRTLRLVAISGLVASLVAMVLGVVLLIVR